MFTNSACPATELKSILNNHAVFDSAVGLTVVVSGNCGRVLFFQVIRDDMFGAN